MDTNIISQNALREAAEIMHWQLGDLDDLPVELANTLANIYYRPFAYKEHLSSGGRSLFLDPYVPESSSMLDAFKNNNKFFAEAQSAFKYAKDVVLSARQTRAEKPELFPYLVTFMLDVFKYNIENADSKTPIRRAIERKFKKVYEIPDLLEIMRKSGIEGNPGQTQATQTSVDVKSAQTTATNVSGFSALHDAAMTDNNNLAIQLLDSGLDVNAPLEGTRDCEGATPLHFAVVNGCVDVAKSLLKRGANVRAVTEYDETPLHWAVGVSELIFEAMLSKGANHRIRNHQGATSLHLSAASLSNKRPRWGILRDSHEEVYFGDFDPNPVRIASLCLSAGIVVNDVDYQGNTALHWACIYPHLEILRLLLSKGGDLEQKSAKGLRPIDHSVLKLRPDICKMLIDAGSPLPSLASEVEDIAIFLKARASESNCIKLADLLLEHDLFPNEDTRRELYEEFQRIQNEGPSHRVHFSHGPGASTLDTVPVIELIDMLLKSGASIDAISKTGDTALLVAAGAGGITMLKYGRSGFCDNFGRQY